MHTPTQFGKLGLGSHPLRTFLSLVSLFLGLGASPAVLGQSTITDNSVTVAVRPFTGGFTATYNTQAAAAGSGNFANRDFGSFSLASDVFTLNGASLTVVEDGNIFDQGQLFIRVFPGSLANNTGATAFVPIELMDGGLVGNVRTFTLSNAGRDLLASVTNGGAGTSHRFDVFFRATDNTTGDIPFQLTSVARRSVFTATGVRPVPTNIGNSNVFISRFGNATETYGASSRRMPLFNDPGDLGLYDINSGQLFLNGGNLTTFESGGDVVQNARLNFTISKLDQNNQQVLISGSTIFLSQVGEGVAESGGITRTFSNSTAFQDLIADLADNGIGVYNITVEFQATVQRSAANGGGITQIRDDNRGTGYTARFTLNGVPIVTATWQGDVNDDWFNPSNWNTNVVPDENTNVVVPDFPGSTANPYPNIFSGVIFTDSRGVTRDNTLSGPALSRNVTLQGTNTLDRTITRLRAGRWRIYGDLTNTQESFIQDGNTVVEFAGTTNQNISGGKFDVIEVSGGGTKNVTGALFVDTSLTFLPSSGLMTTNISFTSANFIELAGRSNSLPNGAQVNGETDASYVRGYIRTVRRDVRANEVDPNTGNLDPRSFGNIGMTLLFTNNAPGDVEVTRTTGAGFFTTVTNSDGTSSQRYGIRRVFGVRPDNREGVVANMTFRYLDSDLVNLGPGRNGAVAEPNLVLFLSQGSGNTFANLGRTSLDQNTNILTRNGVTAFATFTLGDQTQPLPVTLVAFEAKRVGADALVTWGTATEKNNKGFSVEVSTDGKTFRSLGFVASHNANSSERQSYRFIDAEAGKSGNRYYRLNQVDLDGKNVLSPVRVVDFGTAATSATLTASPNPFTDDLYVSVAGAGSGTATLRLTDLTGRTLRVQQEHLEGIATKFSMQKLGDLKTGIYIMQLTLPSGKVQNFKMQKQ